MKKVLGLILALSLVFSLFAVMPVSAEYHYFKQFSLDSGNEVISYEDSFWDSFGENLIKDPTVAAENFDSDGNYLRYAKITADYQPVEINENHWWDKYIDLDNGFVHYYECMQKDKDVVFAGPDENGYYTIPTGNLGASDTSCHGFTFMDRMARSLANRTNVLLRDGTEIDGTTFNSLTDDGSGVIRIPGVSNGASRRIPLPAMEENSYYVVKFKMRKNQDIQDTCILLELEAYDGYYQGGIEPNKGTHDFTGNLGGEQTDTVVFMVYTGDMSFSDPCIDIKNTAGTSTYILFDDFGMYKVSEEYAAAQVDGVKLTAGEVAPPHEHTGGTATCISKAVCEVCGEEYGEFDADNHTAKRWICGKVATTEEDGLRYKICDVCGTRFGDEVIPKIAMPVIEPGDGVPEIVVESKNVAPGETVNVKIAIKNNPGIASMKLTVEFDKGLTLKTPVVYDIAPEETDPEMP